MRELGIDLGTANTVVCHPQQGILLDEPSVMLVQDGGRRLQVVGTGQEAAGLVGREPLGVTALRPLRSGVITDLEAARCYLRALLERLTTRRWYRKTGRAVIAVPAGVTALECRGLLEAADEAGIRKVTTLPEPIAGAVGCGLDPLEKRMQMVVDIGGGTAEVAVFCYGGVVTYRSRRSAGDEMTLAVYRYLREQHQLLVGELVAEQVKIDAATEDGPTLLVEGRDAATGRPRIATVPIAEVIESLRSVTEAIIHDMATCLDDIPPQGVGDVMAEGILVFGGGALVRGFGPMLEKAFGFPVKLAEQPLTCVAEGAARAVRNPALLETYSRSQ